jgi:hypothetical protein
MAFKDLEPNPRLDPDPTKKARIWSNPDQHGFSQEILHSMKKV